MEEEAREILTDAVGSRKKANRSVHPTRKARVEAPVKGLPSATLLIPNAPACYRLLSPPLPPGRAAELLKQEWGQR